MYTTIHGISCVFNTNIRVYIDTGRTIYDSFTNTNYIYQQLLWVMYIHVYRKMKVKSESLYIPLIEGIVSDRR